jgi:hypothetical protein
MWQMISDRCFVYLPKQKALMDKTMLHEKYGYESTEQFLLEKMFPYPGLWFTNTSTALWKKD